MQVAVRYNIKEKAPQVNSKPKVALAHLDAETEATMREAFLTCGVQPVVVTDDPCKRLASEKFEGCAVP